MQRSTAKALLADANVTAECVGGQLKWTDGTTDTGLATEAALALMHSARLHASACAAAAATGPGATEAREDWMMLPQATQAALAHRMDRLRPLCTLVLTTLVNGSLLPAEVVDEDSLFDFAAKMLLKPALFGGKACGPWMLRRIWDARDEDHFGTRFTVADVGTAGHAEFTRMLLDAIPAVVKRLHECMLAVLAGFLAAALGSDSVPGALSWVTDEELFAALKRRSSVHIHGGGFGVASDEDSGVNNSDSADDENAGDGLEDDDGRGNMGDEADEIQGLDQGIADQSDDDDNQDFDMDYEHVPPEHGAARPRSDGVRIGRGGVILGRYLTRAAGKRAAMHVDFRASEAHWRASGAAVGRVVALQLQRMYPKPADPDPDIGPHVSRQELCRHLADLLHVSDRGVARAVMGRRDLVATGTARGSFNVVATVQRVLDAVDAGSVVVHRHAPTHSPTYKRAVQMVAARRCLQEALETAYTRMVVSDGEDDAFGYICAKSLFPKSRGYVSDAKRAVALAVRGVCDALYALGWVRMPRYSAFVDGLYSLGARRTRDSVSSADATLLRTVVRHDGSVSLLPLAGVVVGFLQYRASQHVRLCMSVSGSGGGVDGGAGAGDDRGADADVDADMDMDTGTGTGTAAPPQKRQRGGSVSDSSSERQACRTCMRPSCASHDTCADTAAVLARVADLSAVQAIWRLRAHAADAGVPPIAAVLAFDVLPFAAQVLDAAAAAATNHRAWSVVALTVAMSRAVRTRVVWPLLAERFADAAVEETPPPCTDAPRAVCDACSSPVPREHAAACACALHPEHVACLSCMVRVTEMRVVDKMLGEGCAVPVVSCVRQSCRAPLADGGTLVRSWLSGDVLAMCAAAERLEAEGDAKAAASTSASSSAACVVCGARCPAWWRPEVHGPVFPCAACHVDTCSRCLCVAHPGSLCGSVWSGRGVTPQQLLDAAKAQRCPGCGVLTTKDSACNHMTCSRCRAEWCWACGGPGFEPGHVVFGSSTGGADAVPCNASSYSVHTETLRMRRVLEKMAVANDGTAPPPPDVLAAALKMLDDEHAQDSRDL